MASDSVEMVPGEPAAQNEEIWSNMLLNGHQGMRTLRWIMKRLPSNPRCKGCYNPFGGVGGRIVGLFGFKRSRKNPSMCHF